MSSSQGLCRLKLSPTKECDELSILKSVVLRYGGGMGCYLSIAWVTTWKGSLGVSYMQLMNEL